MDVLTFTSHSRPSLPVLVYHAYIGDYVTLNGQLNLSQI